MSVWPGKLEAPSSRTALQQWPGKPEKLKGQRSSGLRDGDTLEGAETTDGDTVRADNGTVRVWGIDAPERDQRGYVQGSDGRAVAVPIGAQSKNALASQIEGPVTFGNRQAPSYGRSVGSLSAGGEDVGRQALRSGNALAVPSYLASDPARSFDYSEAERLARLNRLGVHGTEFQAPADHRTNPDWTPSADELKETAEGPRLQGLSPEAEDRFLSMFLNPRTETAAIVDYARSQGWAVDPERVNRVRDNYARTGELPSRQWFGRYVTGSEAEGSFAGSLGRSLADAATGTMLAELMAVPATLGAFEGRESLLNSVRSFGDIWQNNRDQFEAGLQADSERVYPKWPGGAINAPRVISQGLKPAGLSSESIYEPPDPRMKAEMDAVTQAWLRDPNRDVEALVDFSIETVKKYGLEPASREAIRAGIIENYVEPLERGERVESLGLVGTERPAGMWDRIHSAGASNALGTALLGATNLGGYVDEVAGGINSVIKGTDYEAERDRLDIAKQDAFDRHPVARIAGELGGAALGYGAVSKLAPTVAGAIARRPIVSSAVLGGIYGTGENNENRIEGGIEGTIGGTAAGTMGRYVLEPALRRIGEAEGVQTVTNAARGLFGSRKPVAAASPVLPGLPGGPEMRAPVAMPMRDEGGEAVSQTLPQVWPGQAERAEPLLGGLSRDALARGAARIQPGDVLPVPSNLVADADELAASQAGRFTEARVPNERELLSRTVYRGAKGPVPKVGPLDMVGWLRLNGGLSDPGGDLRAMGIDNAARRGMDFVGQEARFGPLVADDGRSLDDAAQAAWEAGYFPELSQRPSVNEFLEALGDTYNGGSNRRFHPDDFAEIEGFYGQQSERYALERQRFETGEPVYRDRSVPAQEPQPFPPVAAYEDWGPNPPDFAGNINLAKLESPQDISRALSVTEREFGFDAAKRGRVSEAETERLAADLNMKPADLLKRRKGQAFNAEEALAARQILAKSGNELVNAAKRMRSLGDDPGSEAMAEFREKLLRHVAIQEQVSGMTAEAGRALRQFRMAANSKAVRGEVLTALARAGGGRGDITEAADALIEAAEVSPGIFNALAVKAQKPKWRNKIGELYINMLLSNPPTHIVNSVSNTLTAIAQIPEFATASALGKVRNTAMRGKAADRILASEVGARTFGLVEGTKEGARLFAQALRSGEASDMVSKVEGDEFKAISGLKGEIIRVPTRLLTAEDEFFKGVARRMEINGQAVRMANKEGLKGDAFKARVAELSQNPTDEMLEKAGDYGRYLTYQRQLGEAGRAVSQFTSNNLLGKIVVPFVRTPINLMKFATERSPAAPLLKEWREDFMAGGSRRDLAVARALLGTGLATVIYEAAKNGDITGGLPPDPAKARLMQADGWQPYSIKVGDRYVSYSRVDPFAVTIGVAADMATLPSGLSDKQESDKATMLVASIMGNLASKTWLSGVTDFVSALDDPQRYADSWIQRVAGSFAVPAGVAGAARQIDPVARVKDSAGDAITARIPGLSDNLKPRRDVFGEPVELDSLGPDFLSPFWQSKNKSDPVIGEMLRIEKSLGYPSKQFTAEGEKLDYSPEQYDRYQEIAGRLSYNGLSSLFASPEYEAMADSGKRKAAGDVVRRARMAARGLLDDDSYQIPAKGAPVAFDEGKPRFDSGKGPSWPGKAEGGAKPAQQWPGQRAKSRDVIGKLKGAIPGVGIQSGYRTPEYQADMRSRGYTPAQNSRHLDGSALDLTPPPGKSMAWLMAQVRRLEPDAYLLNEGDHLHVEFSDWFGAPAFGGAKTAGLQNPMEAQ